MNILKRCIKKFDDFIGRNSAHDPYNEMFNRDMWDYYSGNAVPVRENRTLPEAANDPEYNKTTGTACTSGHLACQGGLRGHSVGDIFPYIPYYKGKDAEEVWVHCPDGQQIGPFESSAGMYKYMEYLGVCRAQKDNKGV